jgi:hypothetical protein
MSYFKNYIVFILFVMLFGVQTDLSSQVTKEKYRDVSGLWKVKDTDKLIYVYQLGKLVFFTVHFGSNVHSSEGVFIDDKTINYKGKIFYTNQGKSVNHKGKITLLNDRELFLEWDVSGDKGSQKWVFISKE